ncbi:MAG TPA: PAS domain S-box protein [Smithellaceae bacterium]|nr:PAS domain S-box protein [Smithellaceae bacterium]HQM45090.1 PAS domain S-box protein [Smithellaceae bacterium]
MFSVFPQEDHEQTLRIKRFLMACSAYLIWCFIFVVIFLLGLTRSPIYVMIASLLGLFLCNILIYAMLRTGYNKRFKDPSLTLLQMIIATFWIMLGLYYAESARSVVLLIYIIVFVFGLFKLRVRDFLYLSGFAVAVYAAVIGQLYRNNPESVNKIDILNIVILAMVLPWFSLVGGYINRLGVRISNSLSTIRRITDNIHDVIFVLDMNWHYTYISPSVKFLRGYEPEDVLKQDFFDALTLASQDLTKRTLSEFLESARIEYENPSSRTLQLEVRCQDGTTAWTDTKLSFVRDKNRQPVGILGVMRDITRNRQLEEGLRGSEEKCRALLTNIQEGYFEQNLAGNLTFFNDAFCRILGYPRDELMGMNNRRYMDQETSEKVFQDYPTGGSNRTFNGRMIRKDGAKRYVEGSVLLLKDASGQPKGIRGIILDVTERRLAEEALQESEGKFRSLTDTAQDAIVTTNMKGMITYANPAAQELAGGKSVIGMDMRDFFPPDSLEHQERIGALFNSGFSETMCYESKFQRNQDNQPLYFDIRSSGLLRRNEPSGFLFVARDATERKRSEEETRLMAILDTLTGLYNRRGFITLAEQQIKMAIRARSCLLLFFIDLDGLKFINDNLGHEEGDNAIKRAAVILKGTFRASDITSRLGGDEFAVLVTNSIELPEVIIKRLQGRIDEDNASSNLPYQISMSIGVADYDPLTPCSIQELMSRADERMYKQKKEKKQARQ